MGKPKNSLTNVDPPPINYPKKTPVQQSNPNKYRDPNTVTDRYFKPSIYNEYKNAKQVTQERMYLETMEKVLADIDKVIIDKKAGSGVVPYLPLPALTKKDPK